MGRIGKRIEVSLPLHVFPRAYLSFLEICDGEVLVSVLAVCTAVVSADEVVLKNGDKLDGTITSLDAGKLTINTAYAGYTLSAIRFADC
jgi:hypothetical protein